MLESRVFKAPNSLAGIPDATAEYSQVMANAHTFMNPRKRLTILQWQLQRQYVMY
jgi:hypothetical protein